MVTLDTDVHKRLGTFVLDAQFRASHGITALFGASGVGKTVTLRCVCGLVRPDSGRVSLGGRVLYDGAAGVDVPTRARRIGYVFQQYALFPHLDVTGNVGYGLADRPASERAERVAAMLRLVGLEPRARHWPTDLSGGQQQRVALARALAPSPELLLLDEPFSALDALVRGRLRKDLLQIQAESGIPMVLVTHDLAEVRLLADHLVLFEDGRTLQSGPPEEVLRHPATEQARALVAAATEAS